MRCAITGSLLVLLAAYPTTEATLVVLGDSLVDTGNSGNIPIAGSAGILPASTIVNERLSTGQVNVGAYPGAPYYFGRFTNGPIWIEYAAGALGQAIDNLAIGGANGNTGKIGVQPPFGFVTELTTIPVRSLIDQAEAYALLKGVDARANEDTVIIATGLDEYFQKLAFPQDFPEPASVDPLISSIGEALNSTYAAGARKFVLVNLPPLSAIPFSATLDQDSIDTLTTDHNEKLAALASSYANSNAAATVLQYDLFSFFQSIISDPTNSTFGGSFTNTTGYCYGEADLDTTQAAGFSLPYCETPEDYLFWDVVHPSKHTHQIIGQDFVAKLSTELSANLISKSAVAAAASS